ncbi:UDP-N-acetylglucosamine 1-carboxyvinyltransferase [Kiritimatiella glycovorans]|uniref:UDP-N-acetylglucosamine 1-carboxyvinyltransferase n=1 Tax=Kiritimatiella glycovorans TaxID=1307763 RepID=A0A0G3EK17_9BACT|nr:UDP-N-acetylglucosamine 1-carboxyvinyltransferase [Kiritimatiella glycovorans]AKJ65135.1 UDP-N-acetylglucosamine 1-carboxyvinyltransferase [Kiritimatiella glycovorans]
MSRLVIEGGHRIGGSFAPLGNKNAVLPMIAASLLTDEPLHLRNVPDIRDVAVMLELVESLGAEVHRNKREVEIRAAGVRHTEVPEALCRRVRTSILLAGPLAARHGEATLFPPGGDVIGRRRLDTHFYGLRKLGIEVDAGERYRFRNTGLRAADLLLDEASVTATENIVMASVLAPGTTTLYNAACEPHVQDLCRMLNKMGARISNIGANRLTIEGVEALHGAEHAICPDHIELGSFAAAAAITGGTLDVTAPSDPVTLRVIQKSFDKLNLRFVPQQDGTVRVPAPETLRVEHDYGNAIPKIEDGIWPAFPSDLMSVAIVLATQAGGTILFFEKLFESRMYFIDHLLGMGAHIVQCDPHRVVVTGPAPLHGTRLTSPDIRAGMAMIIAALCAQGTSVIENAAMVDRGYEDVDGRLRSLGAVIERED